MTFSFDCPYCGELDTPSDVSCSLCGDPLHCISSCSCTCEHCDGRCISCSDKCSGCYAFDCFTLQTLRYCFFCQYYHCVECYGENCCCDLTVPIRVERKVNGMEQIAELVVLSETEMDSNQAHERAELGIRNHKRAVFYNVDELNESYYTEDGRSLKVYLLVVSGDIEDRTPPRRLVHIPGKSLLFQQVTIFWTSLERYLLNCKRLVYSHHGIPMIDGVAMARYPFSFSDISNDVRLYKAAYRIMNKIRHADAMNVMNELANLYHMIVESNLPAIQGYPDNFLLELLETEEFDKLLWCSGNNVDTQRRIGEVVSDYKKLSLNFSFKVEI